MTSLFVIALLVFAIGVLLFLLARLMRSYPLVFFGLLALLGSSVMAFVDGQMILGVVWLAMAFTSAVAGAIYFYKNVKGAFWWSFGALLAMIGVAAAAALELGELMQLVIPVGVFVVVGLLGSLVVPRLIHKKKDERKHITNVDVLIGKRLTVVKEAEGELPQRGLIGDVDWSIKPAYLYEKFKVGDVVKVVSVKGVTLLCVRDAKDERKEVKEKRKQEQAEARARAEQRRAEKEAKKAEKAKEEPKVEPVKEEPKKEEPAPVVEEPKEEPKVEEPAPVVEEPAPVVEEPKEEPKVEEPAPVVEEPKEEPKVEEPAPVVEEPAPQPKPKAEFIPFGVRLAQADPFVRDAYNELKAEVLSYGIKSRISSTGDTFRLHTKTYVKMVVAGKYLKLYLALDPEDYKDTTYPFEDASKMGAHSDAPFVFKIKSGLSVRRAKVLIGDAAKKDELVQGEVFAHNYASEVPAE
jgi:membrane protein implicated in regulation of membrane protease activity